MLTLRARLFIIISLAVLIILGISLFLIIISRKNTTSAPGNSTPESGDNTLPKTGAVPGVSVPGQPLEGLTVDPQPSEEAVKNSVKQLAKIFLERYGTYSSDNNYQNIRDVEDLVTGSLWKKLSARLSVKVVATGFTGVTSRVITAEISDWGESAAKVSANLIRTEEKGGTINSTQQTASVSLIKVGNEWLVDKFEVK